MSVIVSKSLKFNPEGESVQLFATRISLITAECSEAKSAKRSFAPKVEFGIFSDLSFATLSYYNL